MRRVALVTGASRGLGRNAALWLADAGFDVALAARTLAPGRGPARRADGAPYQGSLQETASAVRERGGRALTLPFDLLDRRSAADAVDTVVAEWGRIDALVNNALYTNPGAQARVLDLDPEDLAPLFEANVAAQLELAEERAIIRLHPKKVSAPQLYSGQFD